MADSAALARVMIPPPPLRHSDHNPLLETDQ
jgi:hypothetical protein